ncbi:hypothetical protein [Muricomes intestini]|nr:hypothetical protein [Muricomes intestini]
MFTKQYESISRDKKVLELITNLYKGGMAKIGMIYAKDEGKQEDL